MQREPLVQLFIRATALGALSGALASLVVALQTADLSAAPSKALLLAGPLSCLHIVLFWGVGLVALALGAAARRFGSAPAAFTAPRLFWGLTAVGALFITLNDVRRSIDWVQAGTLPLRLLLIGAAAYLVVHTWRSARPASARVRRIEVGAALLAVPAIVLAGVYYAPRAGGTAPVNAAGILALAPRFAPEPEGSLRPVATRPRVLLLGIDGASWDRIERGVARGALPTFARLMAAGLRAPLETLRPTYSPAIWTSMMTGVPPTVHGIDIFYMFQIPRLGVHRLDMPRGLDHVEEFLTATGELKRIPVTSSLRRRKAIWNLADEAGLRSAVLGLWATWPPESLANGLVVSDHASLAKRQEWLDRRKTSSLTAGATMYPPELEERLAGYQRAPDSVTREELAQFIPVDDDIWREFQEAEAFSKGVDLSAFRSTHLSDEFIFAAAAEIWERHRPDLMITYVRAIDELSHFFYEAGVPEAAEELGYSAEDIARYGRVVDRAYAWTDRRMARLVEAVEADPNALLIVVSDHGWEKESDGGYNHNDGPPGIALFYGAGVCASGCPPLPEVSIYDIAPTVLERLGLPLSGEFVGSPVPAFRKPHAVTSVALYGRPLGEGVSVASSVDAELLEKLRALGYLD